MEDEMYRQILRMKALDRWENEGGRVINDKKQPNDHRSAETADRTAVQSDRRERGITEE